MAQRRIDHTCGGTGRVECPRCRGRGQEKTAYMAVTGWRRCRLCQGEKAVQHGLCEGAGFVTVGDEQSAREDEPNWLVEEP